MTLLVHPATRREILGYGSAALVAGAVQASALASTSAPPLQFMVIGDWGRNGAFHQRAVAAAMADFQNAAFVASTGDNFYQHGVQSIADRKWDTSFQQVYTEVPQRWYAVLGNHDYGGSVEAQISKTFHDSRWRMPDYWYDMRLDAYGRPDIHLFFINTVAWRGREKFPYSILGSGISARGQRKQREWLERQIGGSNAPIKIVFGHHPIYSIRADGSYYGMAELDGLLFDHGVTAFVNGHDHNMYHISAPDWRGTAAGRMHYICSGAGSKMRPIIPSCIPHGLASEAPCITKSQLGPRAPFWHAFFTQIDRPELDLKGGLALFEVHSDEIAVRFIEALMDPTTGRRWRERYAAKLPLRRRL